MKCSLVPPSLLNTCLDQVGPILLRAVQRTGGRWKIQHAIDKIESGEQQLWVSFEGQKIYGVVTTRIASYPAGPRLDIVYCAGDNLREWMADMLALLERWGRDNQCVGVELVGREGWVKMLAPFGYEKRYIVMEKSLG